MHMYGMPGMPRKKERWTLTFDQRLKRAVIVEARQRGVHPARILEEAVREHFHPFDQAGVANPTAYVRTLRCKSRKMTDEEFLVDLKRWEKIAF
jgi:hypothetical protein